MNSVRTVASRLGTGSCTGVPTRCDFTTAVSTATRCCWSAAEVVQRRVALQHCADVSGAMAAAGWCAAIWVPVGAWSSGLGECYAAPTGSCSVTVSVLSHRGARFCLLSSSAPGASLRSVNGTDVSLGLSLTVIVGAAVMMCITVIIAAVAVFRRRRREAEEGSTPLPGRGRQSSDSVATGTIAGVVVGIPITFVQPDPCDTTGLGGGSAGGRRRGRARRRAATGNAAIMPEWATRADPTISPTNPLRQLDLHPTHDAVSGASPSPARRSDLICPAASVHSRPPDEPPSPKTAPRRALSPSLGHSGTKQPMAPPGAVGSPRSPGAVAPATSPAAAGAGAAAASPVAGQSYPAPTEVCLTVPPEDEEACPPVQPTAPPAGAVRRPAANSPEGVAALSGSDEPLASGAPTGRRAQSGSPAAPGSGERGRRRMPPPTNPAVKKPKNPPAASGSPQVEPPPLG